MSEVFRKNRTLKIPYWKQGYIYFVSRKYNDLRFYQQEWIEEHCKEIGGEHWQAIFDYVTTDMSATAICIKYYISESTLHRLVKRYYEEFPPEI